MADPLIINRQQSAEKWLTRLYLHVLLQNREDSRHIWLLL